jgi:hypothetical protein
MSDDRIADALIDEIAAEQARLRPLAATTPALEAQWSDVRQGIDAIETSASWRLTTPLRAGAAVVANPRGLVLRVGRRLRARNEN